MSAETSESPGQQVVRQGYLRKLKTMKKKYFVLKSDYKDHKARLEYYDSERKWKSGSQPKRAITLKSCFNINRRLDTKHKHVIALYIKEECFCLVAESEEVLAGWLDDLLRLTNSNHKTDVASRPRHHVWQVNVEHKGLGASRNILGSHNLLLTEGSVAIVKIRNANPANKSSHDNWHTKDASYTFALENIRRCGNSGAFFYMEVGRSTCTGAGELWMSTGDANIANSMNTTILHAMSEPKQIRDRSSSMNDASKPLPKTYTKPNTASEQHSLCAGRYCLGGCLEQCDYFTVPYSPNQEHTKAIRLGSRATISPSSSTVSAINQTSSNPSCLTTTDNIAHLLSSNDLLSKLLRQSNPSGAPVPGAVHHQRTVSLPAGCSLLSKPRAPDSNALSVCHERTRSLPLAGDEEPSEVALDASVTKHHSSSRLQSIAPSPEGSGNTPHHNLHHPRMKAGAVPSRMGRRASTGCRFGKWSPSHTKNTLTGARGRCDSLPARSPHGQSPPLKGLDLRDRELSKDQVDSVHPAASIPEETSYTLMSPGQPLLANSESQNSSEYLSMEPMFPAAVSPAASSCSVTSGTPNTDSRFAEYQLERATSYISDDTETRPSRAYSVGSRPTEPVHSVSGSVADYRTRAFSVGSKTKGRYGIGSHFTPPHAQLPHVNGWPKRGNSKASSVPLLGDAQQTDHVELDFSNHKHSSPRESTPISGGTSHVGNRNSQLTLPLGISKKTDDGYMEMSPGKMASGYMMMKPADPSLVFATPPLAVPRARNASGSRSSPPVGEAPGSIDGYVEMGFSKSKKNDDRKRIPSQPIMIHANNIKNIKESNLTSSPLGFDTTASESKVSSASKTSPGASPQTPVSYTNKKISRKLVNRRGSKEIVTPVGSNSQIMFPLSLNSPASPMKEFESPLEKSEEINRKLMQDKLKQDIEEITEIELDSIMENSFHSMDLTPLRLDPVKEIVEPAANQSGSENTKEMKELKNTAAKAFSCDSNLRAYIGKDTDTLQTSNKLAKLNSVEELVEGEYAIMDANALGKLSAITACTNLKSKIIQVKGAGYMNSIQLAEKDLKIHHDNGNLLSSNPTAAKTMMMECPPDSDRGVWCKPIVAKSQQIIPGFKPVDDEENNGETRKMDPAKPMESKKLKDSGRAVNYASLDLSEGPERCACRPALPQASYAYTEIDFVKSEEYNSTMNNN